MEYLESAEAAGLQRASQTTHALHDDQRAHSAAERVAKLTGEKHHEVHRRSAARAHDLLADDTIIAKVRRVAEALSTSEARMLDAEEFARIVSTGPVGGGRS